MGFRIISVTYKILLQFFDKFSIDKIISSRSLFPAHSLRIHLSFLQIHCYQRSSSSCYQFYLSSKTIERFSIALQKSAHLSSREKNTPKCIMYSLDSIQKTNEIHAYRIDRHKRKRRKKQQTYRLVFRALFRS